MDRKVIKKDKCNLKITTNCISIKIKLFTTSPHLNKQSKLQKFHLCVPIFCAQFRKKMKKEKKLLEF